MSSEYKRGVALRNWMVTQRGVGWEKAKIVSGVGYAFGSQVRPRDSAKPDLVIYPEDDRRVVTREMNGVGFMRCGEDALCINDHGKLAVLVGDRLGYCGYFMRKGDGKSIQIFYVNRAEQ